MADYATLPDLVNLGIAGRSIESVTNQVRLSAIAASSRRVDGYLATRYTLPLIAWTSDLTWATVQLAVYDIFSNRGFSPQPGSDENIRLRYEDAIRWLEKVAAGIVTPVVTDSSGASAGDGPGAPMLEASSSRGWTDREGRTRYPFTSD